MVGFFFIFNIAMSYPNVDNFEAQIKMLILNLNFMKKLKIIFVASAFLIAFTSCEKNEIQQNENTQSTNPDRTQNEQIDESTIIDRHIFPELYVENGVLTFASIEYYESLVIDEDQLNSIAKLTEYLQSSKFKSYGKTNGVTSIYKDEFMDNIMNPDMVVKIGEWFIYVNPENETVKAISDKESNAYQSLLNNSNRTIKNFSIGDDVLDHLKNNTIPQDRACGGIGGFDQTSAKVYVVGSTWYESEFHFNRFGIYFVLKGGFDSNDITGFGSGIELQFMAPELWCQRRPCGAGTIKTRSTAPIPYAGVHQADFKFYDDVRNLNGYYFYCRVKVNYGASTYYSSYVGNSVNY